MCVCACVWMLSGHTAGSQVESKVWRDSPYSCPGVVYISCLIFPGPRHIITHGGMQLALECEQPLGVTVWFICTYSTECLLLWSAWKGFLSHYHAKCSGGYWQCLCDIKLRSDYQCTISSKSQIKLVPICSGFSIVHGTANEVWRTENPHTSLQRHTHTHTSTHTHTLTLALTHTLTHTHTHTSTHTSTHKHTLTLALTQTLAH